MLPAQKVAKELGLPYVDSEQLVLLDLQGGVNLCCCLSPIRPGVHIFMRALELREYEPFLIEKNVNYNLYVAGLGLGDANDCVYVLVSFPMRGISKAEKIAKEFGMSIVRGTPHLLGGDLEGPITLPLVRTGYTLEGLLDHSLYGKLNIDGNNTKKILRLELELLKLEDAAYIQRRAVWLEEQAKLHRTKVAKD